MTSTRYPIRFSRLSRLIFWGILIRPNGCFVELNADSVRVRMDWAFRAAFPRNSVSRAVRGIEGIVLGVGIHGFAGRWLLNGSLHGLVSLHLQPQQRAHVFGIPVKLRELQLSLDDPEAFLAAVQSEARR